MEKNGRERKLWKTQRIEGKREREKQLKRERASMLCEMTFAIKQQQEQQYTDRKKSANRGCWSVGFWEARGVIPDTSKELPHTHAHTQQQQHTDVL